MVTYTYDAWGNILATSGTMASTLGAANPLRYRGYVYDPETGLYYLQSRYYDPALGRFINADAFTSTGQGIIGNNMLAYCLNNPATNFDPSGQRAVYAPTQPVSYGGSLSIQIPRIGGKATGYSLVGTFISAVVSIFYSGTDIASADNAETYADSATIKDEPDEPTVIYRYGGTNPGNLTPKGKDKYTGLSFSTKPMPGAAMTTIEALNATGVVYAVKDGPYHVSVRPVDATVEMWISEGSNSIWTQAVKSAVVKWTGG